MVGVKRKGKGSRKTAHGAGSAKGSDSAAENSTYDREMVIDEFKPLSKVARKRWRDAAARRPITSAREFWAVQAAGHAELLRRIKEERLNLKTMLGRPKGLEYEDWIYRFYHHSFKVFGLQQQTTEIVTALRGLLPDHPLNDSFLEIVKAGTGKEFSIDQNPEWTRDTRPILEAFFHARYFLEMAVRYAALPRPPSQLPSGWAALLTLYGLR